MVRFDEVWDSFVYLRRLSRDLPTPLSHCNVTVAATGLVVGLDGDRLGWLSVAVSSVVVVEVSGSILAGS